MCADQLKPIFFHKYLEQCEATFFLWASPSSQSLIKTPSQNKIAAGLFIWHLWYWNPLKSENHHSPPKLADFANRFADNMVNATSCTTMTTHWHMSGSWMWTLAPLNQTSPPAALSAGDAHFHLWVDQQFPVWHSSNKSNWIATSPIQEPPELQKGVLAITHQNLSMKVEICRWLPLIFSVYNQKPIPGNRVELNSASHCNS